MGSGQLVTVAVLLVCARLSDARYLSKRRPTYWGVNAQKPAEVETQAEVQSERNHSGESAQEVGSFQSKQIQQAAELFSWTFPKDPRDAETKTPLKFELRQPAVTNGVAVRCGESEIQVEVSQNLLGHSHLIKAEELTLGGCAATETDDSSNVLAFKSKLHGCDSTLIITKDAFIYAFTLVYKPQALGNTNIIRARSVVIGIECHYQK